MKAERRFSQRLYAWLVRTYPAEFRDEFGRRMRQDFRTRLAREPKGGLIMLWLRTSIDWLESMPREQVSCLGKRPVTAYRR